MRISLPKTSVEAGEAKSFSAFQTRVQGKNLAGAAHFAAAIAHGIEIRDPGCNLLDAFLVRKLCARRHGQAHEARDATERQSPGRFMKQSNGGSIVIATLIPPSSQTSLIHYNQMSVL